MKTELQRTARGYTETSEGAIKHLRIGTAAGTIDAPVCIVPGLRGNKNEVVPHRDGEKLVYALPGGGTVTA